VVVGNRPRPSSQILSPPPAHSLTRAVLGKLGAHRSGQAKHILRRIPPVVRIPVAIDQNFDIAADLRMGAVGSCAGWFVGAALLVTEIVRCGDT
jgi:hypothetical protein